MAESCTETLKLWGGAVVIALLFAGGRLFADCVVPPHLRWWLTPAVAFSASFLTSWVWINIYRLQVKECRRRCLARRRRR